jgi:hypothetical protein
MSSPNLATLYTRIVVPLGFMRYHYDPSSTQLEGFVEVVSMEANVVSSTWDT